MTDARRHTAGRRRRNSKRLANPATFFILRLVLYWSAAWALLNWFPAIQARAIGLTAWSLYTLLHVVRPDVTMSAGLVAVGTASIQIVPECTPLVPGLLLIGAVAAFPVGARAKVVGLAVGLAGLWLFNLLRLVALIVILHRAPDIYDFAHVYLWQTITVLVAAALFAGWARRTAPPAPA